MNILIINGSPKGSRSNSLKLTNAFVQGIINKRKEAGKQTDVEQIDVCKLHIEPCRGCFACWKATPGKCCISDDMAAVQQKILWADLILYSFPLYYFNIPGVMKNLVDRQLPMVLPFMSERTDGVGSGSHDSRYDMSGKRYVLISTCGFYSAKGNYDSVRSMFDHICGKDNYETVFCGQGELFSVKELASRTGIYLKTVEQAGAEYAEGRIEAETKQKLQELLFPKEMFEKMADASWGIPGKSEKAPADNEESLIFTRQMAALYNPKSYDGKDRVLEMCYTDLDRTYQIALTKEESQVFTDGHLKATTRIETPYSVWTSIAKGEIRGDEALAKQMYRVTGDFSLMMRWDKFFGMDDESAAEDESTADKETNSSLPGEGKRNSPARKKQGIRSEQKPPVMTAMLAAWITFWIAVSIHTQIGALAALGVCACLPLILSRHELAIYDKISFALVGTLSIFASTSGQGSTAVNLGYLLFGLMWLISCFTKEPLCACYVKYGYGGDDALNNPIFMKTNYILAAGWGILYVLIAVWSFLLVKTAISGWLPVLNNGLTVCMGIFTGWFQNWYPAWVAGGKKFKK